MGNIGIWLRGFATASAPGAGASRDGLPTVCKASRFTSSDAIPRTSWTFQPVLGSHICLGN
jgi:hypothetical protein